MYDIDEILRGVPEPYDDERQILAESRLMTDINEAIYRYMRSPGAQINTFCHLIKECITSVVSWRTMNNTD